jgi:hypothetical protein
MANITNRDRWLIAIILTIALFGGAIAGAIAFFWQTVERATLVLLFRDFLQPMGTALLGGLYVWRDLFGEGGRSTSSAEAASQATSQASVAPQIYVHNIIQNPSVPPTQPFDREEIVKRINALEKGPNVIRTTTVFAEQLVITDRNGKARIFLSTDKDTDPAVTLLDDSLRPRAVLGVFSLPTGITPQLGITADDGLLRWVASLTRSRSALYMSAPDGTRDSYLTVSPEGSLLAFGSETNVLTTVLDDNVLVFYDENSNFISVTPNDHTKPK